MHISRVHVENLRSVASLDLDFSDAAGEPRRRPVLIGANGVGKTTILDGIAQVLGPLTDVAGASRLGEEDVHFGTTAAQVEVTLRLTEGEQRRAGTASADVVLSWKSRSAIDWEGLRRSIEHNWPQLVRALQAPGAVDRVAPPPTPEALARTALEPNVAPVVLLPADRGTLQWRPDLTIDQLEHRPRYDALSRHPRRWAALAARLALAWQRPKDAPEARPFHRMWSALQQHMPSIPQPTRAEGLLLWLRGPNGVILPIHRLSDGQRALLLVMAELAYRNPVSGIVLFDEPEQHLHPAWTLPLQAALAELYPGVQFVYTTHSPLFAQLSGQHVLVGSDAALNHDA